HLFRPFFDSSGVGNSSVCSVERQSRGPSRPMPNSPVKFRTSVCSRLVILHQMTHSINVSDSRLDCGNWGGHRMKTSISTIAMPKGSSIACRLATELVDNHVDVILARV